MSTQVEVDMGFPPRRMGLAPVPGRLVSLLALSLRLSLVLTVLSSVPGLSGSQQHQPVAELVEQFKAEEVFWKQLKIAHGIVAAHDPSILPQLEPWLAHPDRHIRGNAALIFGRLGDPRGFETIAGILSDRSERPEGQGGACVIRGNPEGSTPCWSLALQIRSDRYYAVHLFGELKDPRAVPLLVPLLNDPDINYKIPWALEQLGGTPAIQGLTHALRNPSPDVRVFAVGAIERLGAREALPELRLLLNDNETSKYDRHGNYGPGTVSDAARAAIAKLEQRDSGSPR